MKSMIYYLIEHFFKKASEYDQELPQSHTADQPTVQLGRGLVQKHYI